MVAFNNVRPKLLVAGGLGFDRIITPHNTRKLLGGTGFHSSVAGSLYANVALISAVGVDFPREHIAFLKDRGIDTLGLMKYAETTFVTHTRFNEELQEVETIKEGSPYPLSINVPTWHKNAAYAFIADLDPRLQLNILEQLKDTKLTGIDTKLSKIRKQRDALLEAVKRAQILFVNRCEAEALGESSNLSALPEKLARLGPNTIIIKLDKDGALMFDNGSVTRAPAISNHVVEPTGAGDSFAGAFMGYLAANEGCGIFNLTEAFIAGNVAASFTVEDFGSERLFGLNKEDFAARTLYLKGFITEQR
jgi:sugar/nucleoside kinase (ribokinase family)